MKVSELVDALRESRSDAEVVTCLKVPDGEGDYLLFVECPSSFAERYPGDGGRFLVHATVTIGGLVSQAGDPSVIRELAKALEREADSMESGAADCDEEYDIW
ncbi:MAG: hypothetical protein IKF14_07745 [Atopobiaceae bacterium]|nr:hypothetical protein [Atopobiaceae bacterium]